ncbi:8874_t:CDS:1, partial [Racocetra fulgida]
NTSGEIPVEIKDTPEKDTSGEIPVEKIGENPVANNLAKAS